MAASDPVYVISVAARLLEMHPQTLRKYERVGLIGPSRARAVRLYSAEDIARLRFIKQVTEEYGLNLAGALLVLRLAETVEKLLSTICQGDTEVCARQPIEVLLREMMDVLLLDRR